MGDEIAHSNADKMAVVSPQDGGAILSCLNAAYQSRFKDIELHRDMIGWVYFVSANDGRYVLKIYRPFNMGQAFQTVGILKYLLLNGFPVPQIISGHTGDTLRIATSEGDCVGILFRYVDGGGVDLKANIAVLGQQAARLHSLMDLYGGDLVVYGKEFFIDRYLDIMCRMNYTAAHIDALADYGREMWARIERLPKGFCHGNMHTGNMIYQPDGSIALMDFDVAALAFPCIDVAFMSDDTNFNHYDAAGYERTQWLFDKFYEGYSKYRTLADAEVSCIFDFVAVRHYEIVANIVECQGLQEISLAFYCEQYDWLMRWRELCARKRSGLHN